jgi:hypothetical protein
MRIKTGPPGLLAPEVRCPAIEAELSIGVIVENRLNYRTAV